MTQSISLDLQSFLSSYSPEVQVLCIRLRSLVTGMFPDGLEQVDLPGKLIGYGTRLTYKDTLCVIMPQKTWVNLGFPMGVDLPDPAGLLTGTGKRARHVKIRTTDDVDRPELHALLLAALEYLR